MNPLSEEHIRQFYDQLRRVVRATEEGAATSIDDQSTDGGVLFKVLFVGGSRQTLEIIVGHKSDDVVSRLVFFTQCTLRNNAVMFEVPRKKRRAHFLTLKWFGRDAQTLKFASFQDAYSKYRCEYQPILFEQAD